MQDAQSRYHSALELYRTTDMTEKDICEQTGTPLSGFIPEALPPGADVR